LTTRADCRRDHHRHSLSAWLAKRRFGFCEFARRRGDFRLGRAAWFYDEDCGKVANAHVGAMGVSDRPLRLGAVEEALNGISIGDATIAQAEAKASAAIDPPTIFTPPGLIAGRYSASWSSALCTVRWRK